MSEEEEKTQSQRPKTSKLAITSGVCIVVFLTFIPVVFYRLEKNAILRSLALLSLICLFLAPIFGIAAILKIRKNKGLLTGRVISYIAVIIPALIVGLMLTKPGGILTPNTYGWMSCMSNLHSIGLAMDAYSNQFDGKYPTTDKWCGLLLRYTEIGEEAFVCPTGGSSGSHYAMNTRCEPNSPQDMVLLFEAEGGWNQFGGLEILTFENHEDKGCNILFNDGSVKFVKPEEVSELKWNAEESNSKSIK
ncbi:MAG: hypothetical protein ACYSSO_01145 [Planctomycetota bacterium]|jgi:prepilin-type processing-associated H-X9-DG protein